MARKSKAEEPSALTPFAKARMALESGDARRARKLASEAAASGPENERDEARKLLTRLEPDPQPLLVAAAVLILIIIAAWLAILRTR
jgi:FimV-like protein